MSICICVCFFFFKQKTAYELRISDWSSDVCSSDLVLKGPQGTLYGASSIGGLVKYVTVQPDTREFKVRAGVEGFTIKDASGFGGGGPVYVNDQIATDTLALSGSLAWRQTPGCVDRVNHAGRQEQSSKAWGRDE